MLSSLKNNESLNLEVTLTLPNGFEISLDLRSYRKPAKWQTATDGDIRNWKHLLNRCRFPFPKTYWLEQCSISPAWQLPQGKMATGKTYLTGNITVSESTTVSTALGFLAFILLQQQKVLVQYQFTFWVGKRIQVPALNVCWSLWQYPAYFSLDQVLCGAAQGTDRPCGLYLGKADIVSVLSFPDRNKEGVISNLVLALAKLMNTSIS